jgi:small subunit ribosomal protein S18
MANRAMTAKRRPRKPLPEMEGVVDNYYSDIENLKRFLTDHGRAIPARLTGVSAKKQRQIKRAIRRARNVGLLP